jgi:DNA invertase Pin-like site-specific DNA recombinase
MATGKFVSYLRVSTDKQGRSGLGLEAQREAVASFLNGGRWKLVREFVEIESGKRNDRPQLAKALHLCKATGARLVIAKLDRLSRDAHFLLGLQKAGVPFVAADLPEANEMVVGIMAVIAQGERRMIEDRTKAALGAIKARLKRRGEYTTRAGKVITRLGNPNGAKHLRRLGNGAAVAKVREDAMARADGLRGIVDEIRASGATSVRAITEEMNERGILTPRGGTWHPTSVARLLERLAG